MVATSLEAPLKDCKLKADGSTDGTPPVSGWKYKTKHRSTWIEDHHLILEKMHQLPENRTITFSSSKPDLTALKVFGTYRPYSDFYSHGRKVFKHLTEHLFLYGKI